MSGSALPKDTSGEAIQALAPAGTPAKIAVAAASARVALPAGAVAGAVVRIASTTDCYFKFGDSNVAATSSDFLFPAGTEYLKVPAGGHTHIAAIRETVDGVLVLSETA